MGFGERLTRKRVPEWQEAYLEYGILCDLLTPVKLMRKKYVMSTVPGYSDIQRSSSSSIDLLLPSSSERDSMIVQRENEVVSKFVSFVNVFQKLLKAEILKMDFFFHYKLLDQLHRFEFLMINAAYVHKASLDAQFNEGNLKAA